MDWLQFWQRVWPKSGRCIGLSLRWLTCIYETHQMGQLLQSVTVPQWRWLRLWGDTSTSPALQSPLPQIHHLKYPLMHLLNPTLHQHLQWTVKHALPSWYKWPKLAEERTRVSDSVWTKSKSQLPASCWWHIHSCLKVYDQLWSLCIFVFC